MMLTLYHGTSTKYFDEIIKSGLKPRGRKIGNWKHSVKSKKDLVYLTDCYAPYYANAATSKPHKPIIFKIVIDTDDFEIFPDEDFIAQCLAKNFPANSISLNSLTGQVDPKKYQYEWGKSLKHFGNISVKHIPPENIKGYYIGSFMEFLSLQDPCITLLNHIYMSETYKQGLDNLKFIKL